MKQKTLALGLLTLVVTFSCREPEIVYYTVSGTVEGLS